MMQVSSLNNKALYAIAFSFVFINALLIKYEIYWLNILPLAIIIIALAILSLDKVIFFIAFFTPLSLNTKIADFGLALSLPTEPLLGGVLFLALLKFLHQPKWNKTFLTHPITLAILFSIVWNIVTMFSSELKLVSLKFVIARLWFLIAFYFYGVFIFKKISNFKTFLILSLISTCAVVLYTVIRHSFYNFEHEPAHWVMDPFYNDHTSYGAVLALLFPLIIILYDKKKSNTAKLLIAVAFFILTIGIVLSYTRAAWLSLVAAFGIFIIYHFKINLKLIVISASIFIGFFIFFKTDILMKLEKNRQDSSNDMAEHIQSITNINSDASNLERINRWSSAFRMFSEKPILGFGPGTYMFLYAPYQHSSEKTIISTNAGTLGNAHSEYIGPLAEQGIFGTIAYVLIIIAVYYRASVLYYFFEEKDERKKIVLAIIVSFSTYVVHGFINNFLDTDKLAIPFWTLVAMITALDIFHYGKKNKVEKSTVT